MSSGENFTQHAKNLKDCSSKLKNKHITVLDQNASLILRSVINA